MRTAITILVLSLSQPLCAQEYPTIEDKFTPRYLIEEFGTSLGATEEDNARPLIAIALALIKDFEGWIAHAYNDPAGYCTIGYGHLIAKELCSASNVGVFATPLTAEAGANLLEADTAGARLAVQRLVETDLTNEEFGALTSFVFNVGSGAFENSTLLRLLNSGDDEAAARQFGRWIKADGRILNGLIYRRACEAALFRGELTEPFNRATCATLGATPNSGDLVDIYLGE